MKINFLFLLLSLFLAQSCSRGVPLTNVHSTASASVRGNNVNQLSVNNNPAAVTNAANTSACDKWMRNILIPPLLIECILE